ncbi:S-adenosylmethionine:tRNA ribosyltransferase-isomerase [subsurface metagenome]
MNLADYDYNLPAELIAQEPLVARDNSRLMVLPAETDSITHSIFHDMPEFLKEGDLLVINNTRVFPARLTGTKENTGGEVEIFLLHSYNDGTWNALSRPFRRLRTGTVVDFRNGTLRAEIVEKGTDGHVRVKLSSDIDIYRAIDRVGKTPLPPYIKREPVPEDRERYQTVYAKELGAVAAPTAGLHFTTGLLEKLSSLGIITASVILHVGIGTFRPLSDEEARSSRLHSEYCLVPEAAVRKVKECRARGKSVIAVGTTTARALETASLTGEIKPYRGWTDIFIKTPYRFKSVDALITNFHLPRSSLLLMVSAFAGRNRILGAYKEAIRKKYRFYSYGDAMFIIGRR